MTKQLPLIADDDSRPWRHRVAHRETLQTVDRVIDVGILDGVVVVVELVPAASVALLSLDDATRVTRAISRARRRALRIRKAEL